MRELENEVDRLVARAKGKVIDLEELDPTIREAVAEGSLEGGLDEYLRSEEKRAIEGALDRNGHDSVRAAAELRLTYDQFRWRCRRNGIQFKRT